MLFDVLKSKSRILKKGRTDVPDTYPVIILYPTDLRVSKLGGIETAINGYFSKCSSFSRLKFVGVDAVGDLKPGCWNTILYNGKKLDFFPLFSEKELNSRTFPPLNLRFIYYLWKNKSGILARPAVLNFHRADHLIPFWTERHFPVILTIHGTSKQILLPNGSLIAKIPSIYFLLERISLLRADKIFCVSDEGVCHYRRLLGAEGQKVSLIENGVDFDLFAPQNLVRCRQTFDLPLDKKILLFVGRLDKQKDPDLLLQTFREVKMARSDVLLVLAGDGSEKEELLLRHSDLKKDLIFLGSIPHARLPELFSTADCMLMTSHFEGMPFTVLEALATGVPVVSTAVGDILKIVKDGLSGFVIPTRSARALAERVLQMLDNRPSLSDCRASIGGFDANAVLQKIEQANQELARNFYGQPV